MNLWFLDVPPVSPDAPGTASSEARLASPQKPGQHSRMWPVTLVVSAIVAPSLATRKHSASAASGSGGNC